MLVIENILRDELTDPAARTRDVIMLAATCGRVIDTSGPLRIAEAVVAGATA